MGSRRSEVCVGLNCTTPANRVWYCIDCDSFLCDPCWSQYQPHTGGRKGRDGLEHERTKHNVYLQLKHILNPKYTRDELENLHYRDLDTTWFGTSPSGRCLQVIFTVFIRLTVPQEFEELKMAALHLLTMMYIPH